LSKEEKEMESLVQLPSGELWKDTGEGGMEFYFVVKAEPRIPSVGSIIWQQPDVCFNKDWDADTQVAAAILISSTTEALWNDHEKEYFIAKYDDLTSEGKTLYSTLSRIFGDGKVEIVTLLDT
jgi:hypothetical protein